MKCPPVYFDNPFENPEVRPADAWAVLFDALGVLSTADEVKE